MLYKDFDIVRHSGTNALRYERTTVLKRGFRILQKNRSIQGKYKAFTSEHGVCRNHEIGLNPLLFGKAIAEILMVSALHRPPQIAIHSVYGNSATPVLDYCMTNFREIRGNVKTAKQDIQIVKNMISWTRSFDYIKFWYWSFLSKVKKHIWQLLEVSCGLLV